MRILSQARREAGPPEAPLLSIQGRGIRNIPMRLIQPMMSCASILSSDKKASIRRGNSAPCGASRSRSPMLSRRVPRPPSRRGQIVPSDFARMGPDGCGGRIDGRGRFPCTGHEYGSLSNGPAVTSNRASVKMRYHPEGRRELVFPTGTVHQASSSKCPPPLGSSERLKNRRPIRRGLSYP